MKIDINAVLVNDGEAFCAEYSGPFAGVTFLGQRYEFADGVHVKVDYFLGKENEDILVTGSFESQTCVSCSKCLKEFMYTVSFKFAEYYKKSPEETDYAYKGYSIDLSQMLQENLLECHGLHLFAYLLQCLFVR